MASLTGNSINSTYSALMKTADNAALNAAPGALKNITDGVGNQSPISLNQTEGQIISDNFVIADATITHGLAITATEAQAAGPWTYSGTQDFTGATVLGIGGGSVGNYQNYPWQAEVSGYGSAYARTSQSTNCEIYWDAAVDQNANTIIFGKLFLDPTETVSELITPFLGVVADDTYSFGIYDTYPNGAPKDLVFSTTIGVIGASGNQYVSTPITFAPTQNRYWFAFQTANAGNSKIGVMNRSAFQNNYFTYGAWGSSPVGLLAINSLYDNSHTSLPTSYANTDVFGHRDEGALILYKTA